LPLKTIKAVLKKAINLYKTGVVKLKLAHLQKVDTPNKSLSTLVKK